MMYTAHEQWGYYCKDTSVYVDKKLSRMPYAQAGVRFENGSIILVSYSTVVCVIDEHGFLTCTGTYSRTTIKHISAFLKEYAPLLNYYNAKRCYQEHEAINIATGEIISLGSK